MSGFCARVCTSPWRPRRSWPSPSSRPWPRPGGPPARDHLGPLLARPVLRLEPARGRPGRPAALPRPQPSEEGHAGDLPRPGAGGLRRHRRPEGPHGQAAAEAPGRLRGERAGHRPLRPDPDHGPPRGALERGRADLGAQAGAAQHAARRAAQRHRIRRQRHVDLVREQVERRQRAARSWRQAQQYGVEDRLREERDGSNGWSQFNPSPDRAAQSGAGCAFAPGSSYTGRARAPRPRSARRPRRRAPTAWRSTPRASTRGSTRGPDTTSRTCARRWPELPGVAGELPLRRLPPRLSPTPSSSGPGGAQFNQPQVYWKAIGTSPDTALGAHLPVEPVYGRPIVPLGQLYNGPSAKGTCSASGRWPRATAPRRELVVVAVGQPDRLDRHRPARPASRRPCCRWAIRC